MKGARYLLVQEQGQSAKDIKRPTLIALITLAWIIHERIRLYSGS